MAQADNKDTLLNDYQQTGIGDEQGNESLDSSNTEADAKAKAKKPEAAKNDFGKIVEILPSKLVLTDKGLKFPNTGGFKVGDTLVKENGKVVARKGK